jgi:ABC-type transport system involved in multi-copper enzyme maturation permease subunit
MRAVTVPGRSEEDASPRPLPWRRMAWVTWRQHRVTLAGVGTMLGGLAVYMWVSGRQLHHSYTAATACHPASSPICGELVGHFNGMASFLADGTILQGFLAHGIVLQALPALIGAFVAAPVLGRELETGTFRYAWTQGFGRSRWTLAKLVALAAVVAGAAGAISVLFSWYYQPYFAAGNQTLSLSEASPFYAGLFDLRGVAFAAWTLVAFAIGGLAGLLIRRVVPAIAATLAVYTALALAAALYLRQHYLPPLVTNLLNVPGSAWIIGQRWLTKGGKPVSQSVLSRVLQKGGPQLSGKGGVPRALSSWQYLVQHGYTQRTTYQPASRFWQFQWIEGGWLLGLSLLLIAATIWLVRRRTT